MIWETLYFWKILEFYVMTIWYGIFTGVVLYMLYRVAMRGF